MVRLKLLSFIFYEVGERYTTGLEDILAAIFLKIIMALPHIVPSRLIHRFASRLKLPKGRSLKNFFFGEY
jgi:hypothetical protein